MGELSMNPAGFGVGWDCPELLEKLGINGNWSIPGIPLLTGQSLGNLLIMER